MKIDLYDRRLDVCGLPFVEENKPDLYRLPRNLLESLPEGVATQARYPCGGRVRFSTNGQDVAVHLSILDGAPGQELDIYVDGCFWCSIPVDDKGEMRGLIFEGLSRSPRVVEIYLPYRKEIRISGIEVSSDSEISSAPSYDWQDPIVFYGSSVAQGVGVRRPSMSYPALLGRKLNADYVNFGFGGAGKAEAHVVHPICELRASCFVLDLGKSYGMQPVSAYTSMLRQLRSRHPETPIICLTPIYSSRERRLVDYQKLSIHTREVVHTAASDLDIVVIDGFDLLGPDDGDCLSGDGVHPSELGYSQISERLLPILQRCMVRSMSK